MSHVALFSYAHYPCPIKSARRKNFTPKLYQKSFHRIPPPPLDKAIAIPRFKCQSRTTRSQGIQLSVRINYGVTKDDLGRMHPQTHTHTHTHNSFNSRKFIFMFSPCTFTYWFVIVGGKLGGSGVDLTLFFDYTADLFISGKWIA